jgi:hypothetical protein
MAFITPDLSLFQPQGLPQEPPQATDPSQIAKLLQEMAGHGQEGMLQELIRQGMTKGLGSDRAPSTTDTGRLNFQQDGGGAVGYAGPLRQSDRPMDTVVPAVPPQLAQGMESNQRARNISPDIGKVLDMLGALPKGTGNLTEGALVNQIMPGAVPFGQIGRGGRVSTAIDDRAHAKALENSATFFNKKTGETLATDFPDSAPDLATIRNQYVGLKPQQIRNFEALSGLDHQIEKYESLIGRLGLPEKEGMASTAKSGLDIKRRRMSGDPDVAALDAVRAEITQLAGAFGGDSRVSNDEMRRLDKAVISDFDNKKSAGALLEVLKDFRNSKAKKLPIPGIHDRKTWAAEAQPQQQQAPSGGPQPGTTMQGYRFKGGNPADRNNWEKQ